MPEHVTTAYYEKIVNFFLARTKSFKYVASYVGWVCCWFSSLLRGFFSGSPVFLSPQKSTFLNSNSIGNSRATGLLVSDCYVPPSLNKVVIIIIITQMSWSQRCDKRFVTALSRKLFLCNFWKQLCHDFDKYFCHKEVFDFKNPQRILMIPTGKIQIMWWYMLCALFNMVSQKS